MLIVSQALGGGDAELCAQLYSWQADACMGLAGQASEDSRQRMSNMSKADEYLDRALKCEYVQLSRI
jgi:anaphase-promoting complex subunit 5